MTVKVIRLTSGEEIIAKVTTTDNGYYLTNPLILLPTEKGKLTFATWMPYMKDDRLFIQKGGILFDFTPVDAMAAQYLKSTSSIDLSAATSL